MKDEEFERIAREIAVNRWNKNLRQDDFILMIVLTLGKVAEATKREVVEGCIGIVETHECKQCASQYGPGEDDDKPDCEEIAAEIKRKILGEKGTL